MNKFDALTELKDLLGVYRDPQLENFVIQTELLSLGFTLNNVVPLVRYPKLINIIKNHYELFEGAVVYYRSFQFQFHGKGSINHLRKNRIHLFFDDQWIISITNPEYQITKKMSGMYLFDTLRQGINAVIPKMIKEKTGKSIHDQEFKDVKFSLEIKLDLSHENYHDSSRSKLLKSIEEFSQDSAVFKTINPANLFMSLSFNISSNAELIKERLKLWQTVYPGNLYKASKEEFHDFISKLPVQDFGIKNIKTLNSIMRNFNTTISNELLLLGEVGENILEIRACEDFHKKLLSFFP